MQNPSYFGIPVFGNQPPGRLVQGYPNGDGPILFGLSGNVLDGSVDHVSAGHLVEVADPATDQALEDKDVTLRLQILIVGQVGVGQGFKLGAFLQKSFALLALNQWNVNVVLLAPAFAVDPYSGADMQPNVPRDIKSQMIFDSPALLVVPPM